MPHNPEYVNDKGIYFGGAADDFVNSLRTSFELPQDYHPPKPGDTVDFAEVERRFKGFEIVNDEVVLEETLCTKVAQNLLDAVGFYPGKNITIQYMSQQEGSMQLVRRVEELARAAGSHVDTFNLVKREQTLLLKLQEDIQSGKITMDDARQILESEASLEEHLLGDEATGIVCIRDEMPKVHKGINKELVDLRAATRQHALNKRIDERRWTLEVLPTKDLVDDDDEFNGDKPGDYTLEDYMIRWRENARRNYIEVLKAHEKLLETLNKAHRVRIVDYPDSANPMDTTQFITDLTVSTQRKKLDGTYRPGVWASQSGGPSKNPGSEVFISPSTAEEAAPFVGGAFHGKIKFPTSVTYVGKTIPAGLTFICEGGKIVDWNLPDSPNAEEAREWIKTFIEKEGMRFVGELGWGTNPIYRVHPLNKWKARPSRCIMTQEKADIHFTPGFCYKNEPDDSVLLTGVIRIADLDNGNKSPYHEDEVLSHAPGTISDRWVDIGEYDASGVYTPEWVLIERNGVFLEREKVDGKWLYWASDEMEILSSPTDDILPFSIDFPPHQLTDGTPA